jgi:hypothetical protein
MIISDTIFGMLEVRFSELQRNFQCASPKVCSANSAEKDVNALQLHSMCLPELVKGRGGEGSKE